MLVIVTEQEIITAARNHTHTHKTHVMAYLYNTKLFVFYAVCVQKGP
jgi:hypothetical protein